MPSIAPSRRLLNLLCAADVSPPDFLCPHSTRRRPRRQRADSEPGPSHHQRRRRLPEPPPPPPPPLLSATKRDKSPARHHSRMPRHSPPSPDSIPYPYTLSPDGTFHRVQRWQLRGRGMTCSGWPESGNGAPAGTPSFDLSSGSANTSGGVRPDTSFDSDDPNSSDFIMSNLPPGWNPSGRPMSSHPAGTTIGLSITLALTIAAFIIGLVLWRRPLRIRRKRTPSMAAQTLEKKLQMLWEAEDAERGVPGKDEDSTLAQAAKAKKKAWNSALARWKSKAKGKVPRRVRPTRDAPHSDSTTLASPASSSRAASIRTRVSFDAPATAEPGRGASESTPTLAAQVDDRASILSSSPDRGETAASPQVESRPRTPPPPPPPPSPPLEPTRHAGRRESHAIAAPVGRLPQPDDAIDNGDDADPVVGPPAYRRSYLRLPGTSTGAPAAYSSGANDSAASVTAGPNGSRTGVTAPSSRGNNTRIRMDIASGATRQVCCSGSAGDIDIDRDHKHPVADAELEPSTMAPIDEELQLSDAFVHQVHQAHVATDDKALLARIADFASAPDSFPEVSGAGARSPVAACAPEWRDEEYEDFVDMHEGPSLSHLALPRPPAPIVQPSLGYTALAATSATTLPGVSSGTADWTIPSAQGQDLMPSAPPKDDEHSVHTASAPPLMLDGELEDNEVDVVGQDVVVSDSSGRPHARSAPLDSDAPSLPRYEP